MFDLTYGSRVLVCWKDRGILSLLLVTHSLLDIKLESISCLIALFLSTVSARRARDALLFLLLLLLFDFLLSLFPSISTDDLFLEEGLLEVDQTRRYIPYQYYALHAQESR